MLDNLLFVKLAESSVIVSKMENFAANYIKQIRLQEARRLMLGEDLDAASAGFRVGYDDASHFNREFKRLFGNPLVEGRQRS